MINSSPSELIVILQNTDFILILIGIVLMITLSYIFNGYLKYKNKKLETLLENRVDTLTIFHMLLNEYIQTYDVKLKLEEIVVTNLLAEDYIKIKEEFVNEFLNILSKQKSGLYKHLLIIFSNEEAIKNYIAYYFDKKFWVRYVEAIPEKPDTVIQG